MIFIIDESYTTTIYTPNVLFHLRMGTGSGHL
jgi:hypothetical protein